FFDVVHNCPSLKEPHKGACVARKSKGQEHHGGSGGCEIDREKCFAESVHVQRSFLFLSLLYPLRPQNNMAAATK
ncbi:MAG: hypothetical protein IIV43_00820, partial [Oscillospiraceae bacterium]|nr:hypothetical protein [Oscillospiraceae bacterium]